MWLFFHILIILECLDEFKACFTEQEIASSKILCCCHCHRSWWSGRRQKTKPPAPQRARLEEESTNSPGCVAAEHGDTSRTHSTEQGPVLPSWDLFGLQGAGEAPCQARSQSVPQSKPSPSPTISFSLQYLSVTLDNPKLSSKEISPGWTSLWPKHCRKKAK